MATTGTESRTQRSHRLEANSSLQQAHHDGRKVSLEVKPTEDKKKEKRNIHVTAKYNRTRMRQRLNIEEWMDSQLRQLYECEEDEDYPVEIDIDVLLETNGDEARIKCVEETLADVRQSTKPFITELLKKIEVLS